MTATGVPRDGDADPAPGQDAEAPEATREAAAVPVESTVDIPGGTPEVRAADRTVRRRVVAVAAVLAVAAAGAGVWLAIGRGTGGSGTGTSTHLITITTTSCGTGWKPSTAASQTFSIVNRSGRTGEIYLLDSTGAVIGEIEGLGPQVKRTMTVTLPDGRYKWLCVMTDQPVLASAYAQVTGSTAQAAPAVLPVSEKDMAAPVAAYQAYVAPKLAALAGQVAALRAAVAAGSPTPARTAWLSAQLTWEQVGAAYDSFGDLGDAIDGLPDGLPGGVRDPGFTGLHRVEYGLWHGESGTTLLPVVDKLAADVATLRTKLPQVTMDPNDLSLRAHEILEDALRDHLTGTTDQGGGAGFAETSADLEGTRVVLDELAPLLDRRRPDLLPTARDQMAALQAALQATRTGNSWQSPATAPLSLRQHVNAALGDLLETLASIPDLLEIRSAAQATN